MDNQMDIILEQLEVTPSERSSNFTSNEIEKLQKLITKYSKIILNKKTNGFFTKQKDEAWDTITSEFNSSNGTYRSVKQLKCKWEYMKKTARKEAGRVNRMRRQTGGGPPPPSLSTTDEWVADILKESATGNPSQYDGDAYNDIVVEPPPASCFATVNIEEKKKVEILREFDVAPTQLTSTPKSCTKKPYKEPKKILSASSQNTRQSFLELANKKKELVELKTRKIENKDESSLARLREEKCRLEMDLLKRAFENDERRKQELHELQVKKMKLEILSFNNKTE